MLRRVFQIGRVLGRLPVLAPVRTATSPSRWARHQTQSRCVFRSLFVDLPVLYSRLSIAHGYYLTKPVR